MSKTSADLSKSAPMTPLPSLACGVDAGSCARFSGRGGARPETESGRGLVGAVWGRFGAVVSLHNRLPTPHRIHPLTTSI